MHSALSLASLLLAASGAFALPQTSNNATASTLTSSSGADKEVRVILQNQAIELGSQTAFKNVDVRKHKRPVGSSGPFETIEIDVGADAQQDLRCQVLDLDGKPIIATRGENVDITFSDADKGAWTFVKPSEVSRIICDPTFESAQKEDFEVAVTLANGREYSYDTVFQTVVDREELPPTGGAGPFNSVDISVGALVDPALRCQLINARGKKVVATRGANTDTTFSDADKGPWYFSRAQKIRKVICDESFVAMPQ